MNQKIISALLLSFVLASPSAFAAKKKKVSHKEAKRLCLSEQSDLAGKELQRCIKRRKK